MLPSAAPRMRDSDLAWFLILATWAAYSVSRGVGHLGHIAAAFEKLVTLAERGRK